MIGVKPINMGELTGRMPPLDEEKLAKEKKK